MTTKLPDELLLHIFDYANIPYDCKKLYNHKHYKHIELARYKKHNASQLLKLLYTTYKDLFLCIIQSQSSTHQELREYINDYYGSYDEYYMIDFLACIEDFKDLENNILNTKAHSKYIKNKNIIKTYNSKFIKNYRTIYSLTLETPNFYSSTISLTDYNPYHQLHIPKKFKNQDYIFAQYIYNRLDYYSLKIQNITKGKGTLL